MRIALFSRFGEYAKAAATLAVAVGGALVTALTVGNVSLGDLSAKEWVTAGIAVITSAGFVHYLDNISGVAGSVAKAIAAAATSGLGALALAMADDSVGGQHVTQVEWIGAIVTAIVATGFVYQTTDSGGGSSG